MTHWKWWLKKSSNYIERNPFSQQKKKIKFTQTSKHTHSLTNKNPKNHLNFQCLDINQSLIKLYISTTNSSLRVDYEIEVLNVLIVLIVRKVRIVLVVGIVRIFQIVLIVGIVRIFRIVLIVRKVRIVLIFQMVLIVQIVGIVLIILIIQIVRIV